MNQKNFNFKSKKSDNENSKDNSTNPQIERDRLKEKIMEKYDLSSDQVDQILYKVEQNKKVESTNNNVVNKNVNHSSPKKSDNANFNNDSLNHQSENDSLRKKIMGKYDLSSNQFDQLLHKAKRNEKVEIANNKVLNENVKENLDQQKVINNEKNSHKDMDVDSLLEDIVPVDYGQQISIDVNHVDLTFEVQNERVDTLKENFVRFLRRDKSKKIKFHALKDVSFQIYKGEKIGIIGYNGAGKSTLLNVITGIYPPDNGSVTTYGKISPLLSLGAGFDPNFSGRKNIILNGAVLGYDKEFLESKIDEIIEFSELGDFIDIPIKNYSNGMLAKLGFSIATSVNPDILIIDEILGVGDVNFRRKSTDKIRSLMDGGTTVLLVSHSIVQIRNICEKAIWIDNGKVREMGEVNKVCDHYLKDAENASNEQLANIKLFS